MPTAPILYINTVYTVDLSTESRSPLTQSYVHDICDTGAITLYFTIQIWWKLHFKVTPDTTQLSMTKYFGLMLVAHHL